MYNFSSLLSGKLIRGIEYLLDAGIMIFSLYVVFLIDSYYNTLELGSIGEVLYDIIEHWPVIVLYIVLVIVFFNFYNVSIVLQNFTGVIVNMFLALFFINIVLLFISILMGGNLFDPPYLAILVFFIQFFVFFVYKGVLYILFKDMSRKKVLIFGFKDEVNRLTREFYANNSKYFTVKYALFKDKDSLYDLEINKYVDKVDSIFISESLDTKSKNYILNYASLEKNKEVFIVPKTYEIITNKSVSAQVDDTLVLKAESMYLTLEQRFLKRTIDVLISSILLIIALPFMLIIALIIKLQDGGPVFYKQTRLKRFEKEFQILKFRSMKPDADGTNGPVTATRNDARITPFGKFIRATRLDELPQLINVLKGEMSLVGPRPLIPNEINQTLILHPEFKYRSNVKPGLTGLSQVYSYYDTPLVERLRYDLLYIRTQTLLMDFKIMFLTAKVMMSKNRGLGRDKKTLSQLLSEHNVKVNQIQFGNTKGYEFKIDKKKKEKLD